MLRGLLTVNNYHSRSHNPLPSKPRNNVFKESRDSSVGTETRLRAARDVSLLQSLLFLHIVPRLRMRGAVTPLHSVMLNYVYGLYHLNNTGVTRTCIAILTWKQENWLQMSLQPFLRSKCVVWKPKISFRV
jgi:hypothetical protein